MVGQLEVDVALVLVDFMNEELELREGYEDEWLACEVGRRPDVVPVSRFGSAMHVSDVLFLERSSCQKVGESRHMRQEHACGQSFNTTIDERSDLQVPVSAPKLIAVKELLGNLVGVGTIQELVGKLAGGLDGDVGFAPGSKITTAQIDSRRVLVRVGFVGAFGAVGLVRDCGAVGRGRAVSERKGFCKSFDFLFRDGNGGLVVGVGLW